MDYPFERKPEEYKRELDFSEMAIKQYSRALHLKTGKPLYLCEQFIRNRYFSKKEPRITLVSRNNNGDREIKRIPFDNFFKVVDSRRLIFAPNFNIYYNKNQKLSLVSECVKEGFDLRAANKKMRAKAEEEGDVSTYLFKDAEQNANKTFINMDSGVMRTKGSVFYLKTLHNSLTSNTRCGANYASIKNESLISGNKNYYDLNQIYDDLIYVIDLTQIKDSGLYKDDLERLISKYNLHIPDTQDVMAKIKRSAVNYILKKGDYYNELEDFVSKLPGYVRVAYTYVIDMYHFRKHNRTLFESMMDELTFLNPLGEEEEVLYNSKECFEGLANEALEAIAYVNKDYIRGIKIKSVDNLAPNVVNAVCKNTLHFKKTLDKYSDLLKFIVYSLYMPLNVAKGHTTVRRCTIMGDTDSSVYTAQEYAIDISTNRLDDRYSRYPFIISFFSSTSIKNILMIMSKNSGVDDEDIGRFTMKSEFFFSIFIKSNLAKTYRAVKQGVEGLILKESKEEVKGKIFLSGDKTPEVSNHFKNMSRHIIEAIEKDKHLNLEFYLREVIAMEKMIYSKTLQLDPNFMGSDTIKPTYNIDLYRSKYIHYILWEKVFASRYGSVSTPPYNCLTFNSTINNKTDMKRWRDSLPPDMQESLDDFFKLLKSKGSTREKIQVFYLPKDIIKEVGIIEEIKNVIDYKSIIRKVLNAHYLLLESLGFFVTDESSNGHMLAIEKFTSLDIEKDELALPTLL